MLRFVGHLISHMVRLVPLRINVWTLFLGFNGGAVVCVCVCVRRFENEVAVPSEAE